MYNKLVLSAYKKAKRDTNSKVVSHQSIYISEVLLEDYRFQVNERTLRNYYNKIKNQEEEEINMSRQISLHLSKFLGYKDFKNFIAIQTAESSNISDYKSNFDMISVSIITLLLRYIMNDIEKRRAV